MSRVNKMSAQSTRKQSKKEKPYDHLNAKETQNYTDVTFI